MISIMAPKASDYQFVFDSISKCKHLAETSEAVCSQIHNGIASVAILKYPEGRGVAVWRMLGDVMLLVHLRAPGVGINATIPVLEALILANGAKKCKFYATRQGWRRVLKHDPRGKVTSMYEVEIDLAEDAS